MTIHETIDPKATDDTMIGKERWAEVRRLKETGGTVLGIARQLGVDRKTVRHCLGQEAWHRISGPYEPSACWRRTPTS